MAWDGMMVYTSTHPLMATDGRTLQLYYQGQSCSHHGGYCVDGGKNKNTQPAVGLATLRPMGWVSMSHSGGGSGSVTTTALAAVPKLKVNFAARPGGSVEVTLLDAATGAAARRSAPLTGDELEAEVVWHGGAEGAMGAGGVRIEFVLTGDVELYSYLVG